MTTDNITTLHPLGNRPGLRSDIERLITPLDLAEAERSAWLEFRLRRRAFRRSRTLADEIKMLEARDAWVRAFRQVERQEVAA